MNTDQRLERESFSGIHSRITDPVIRIFYDVYNELGAGFLESVYQAAFGLALREAGLQVESQVPLPVYFRGHIVGEFRADLVINQAVLLELKATQSLDRSHEAQVLNYLKATPLEVGLLLNFGPKPQFKRIVLDNDQKKIRVHPCSSVVSSLEVGR
jgi:GxxExxY protein